MYTIFANSVFYSFYVFIYHESQIYLFTKIVIIMLGKCKDILWSFLLFMVLCKLYKYFQFLSSRDFCFTVEEEKADNNLAYKMFNGLPKH